MSELNSEQKYHLATKLVSILESMLLPPRQQTQKEQTSKIKEPLPESQYLNPEMEDRLSQMAQQLLRAETVEVMEHGL